nr:roadblock/LC7 domain-containing protein [Saccharopolyspora hordei]
MKGDVLSAVLVSADGLELAHSRDEHGVRDQLSAGASGIASIARGLGHQLRAGAQRQSVIEWEHAMLFLVGVSDGSLLALVSAADADIGDVAYHANLLVEQVGEFMVAAPRHGTAPGQISLP